MLNPENDPLAGLYIDEEEVVNSSGQPQQTPEDPLAGLYINEETGQKEEEPYRDIVSENLRAQGYEPEFSEELERATEAGTRNFLKGALSEATLGLSEKPEFLGVAGQFLPDLTPKEDFSGKSGKIVGSFLPIERIYNLTARPVVELAKRSPFLTKTLTYLGNLVGAGVAGGTYGGIEHAVKEKELPSLNDVLEHGAEWAALEAVLRTGGQLGKFTIEMLKAGRKTKEPSFKLVNEVYNTLREQGVDIRTEKRAGAKALSIIEDIAEGKPTSGIKNRDISVDKIKKAEENLPQLSEPILPEAQEIKISPEDLVKDAEKQGIRSRMNAIGQRLSTDTELGKDIKEGITSEWKAQKAEYQPFYDEVNDKSQYIIANPETTADAAGDMLILLEELRTKPDKYSKVINALETSLSDIGYKVQRDVKTQQIENIIKDTDIGANKLIELGRRLNEIINYDVIDKSIQDRLKPIVKMVKSDIRTTLREFDPDLEAAFDLAEKAHAITEKKFNRKSIRAIRAGEDLEDVVKGINSATDLKDLREVTPPKTMRDVERHILEKMDKMNEARAEDFLRRVSSGLSKDSRELAQDIVASKRPIGKRGAQSQKELLQDTVDGDLYTSMLTGERPTKTLKLWQNPRGNKLVRGALETHPQKDLLTNYLEKQTMQDMASTILTKDGQINVEALSQLMKNPAMEANIRDLGGEEAVQFFKKLSERTQGFKKNANQIGTEALKVNKEALKKEAQGVGRKEAPSPREQGRQLLKRMARKDYPLAARVNQALDLLGFSGKVNLTLFTALKFGLIKGALIPIAAQTLLKMATSPRVRKAFIEASKPIHDPIKFLAAVEALGVALDEED